MLKNALKYLKEKLGFIISSFCSLCSFYNSSFCSFYISSFFSFLQKPHVLAIEINTTQVTLLEMFENKGRYFIENYSSIQILNDDWIETLTLLLKEFQTNCKQIALAISGPSIITRRMLLEEDQNLEELEELIELMFEQVIPFPLEDSYYDYLLEWPKENKQHTDVDGHYEKNRFQKRPTRAEILLVTSPRHIIEEWIDSMSTLGLKLVLVTETTFSARRALDSFFDQNSVLNQDPLLDQDSALDSDSVLDSDSLLEQDSVPDQDSVDSGSEAKPYSHFFCSKKISDSKKLSDSKKVLNSEWRKVIKSSSPLSNCLGLALCALNNQTRHAKYGKHQKTNHARYPITQDKRRKKTSYKEQPITHKEQKIMQDSFRTINLLPWREEERKTKNKRFLILWAASVVLGITTLAIQQGYYLHKKKQEETLRESLLKVKNEVMTKVNLMKKLQHTKNLILERQEMIQSLRKEHEQYVTFVTNLPKLLPEAIYLKNLILNQGIIMMEGNASTHSAVAALMKILSEYKGGVEEGDALEKSRFFKELKLNEITSNKEGSGFTFHLQCRLDRVHE